MTRVAIYARVSTERQNVQNQIRELQAFATAKGWTIVDTLRETEHGWDPDRRKLAYLLELTRNRKVDAVLVWAVDRFSRQGVLPTLKLIDEIRRTGCEFHSYREEWLRSDNPLLDVMLPIVAWAARQEHLRTSERTKAGLARVRAENRSYAAPRGHRPVGRAPKYAFDRERARALRQSGLSWNRVLTALQLPRNALTTVRRVCQNGSQTGQSTEGPE